MVTTSINMTTESSFGIHGNVGANSSGETPPDYCSGVDADLSECIRVIYGVFSVLATPTVLVGLTLNILSFRAVNRSGVSS